MASTHDEAFREIQLSGKQLVFVFMAGVVILVVTFLFGVQVGRGVLVQRGTPESIEASAASVEEPAPPPSSASPASGAPVTAGEKLSYAERLAAPEPAAESLKKPEAPAEVPTPRSEAPPAAAPASPAPVAAKTASAAASTEPAGTGFAIQVAALKERSEADAIVKRLAGKGYSAYVVAPRPGDPAMYRVRVGKFKDRREADTVAARLQKEEQFKPWVVR